MRTTTITLSDELEAELQQASVRWDPELTIEQLIIEILEKHALLSEILGAVSFAFRSGR